MSRCKICESPAREHARKRILGKYEGIYLRCDACGFVWVDAPHWLEEAYSRAITALDTGIVTRNLWLRDVALALLGTQLRDVRHILDHGGGTGLFVRLLRDAGHDAWWWDAHCDNLLARGYEAESGATFDMVTAFEVVEHFVEPMPELLALRERAPRLLISTELQPSDPAALMGWHYLAPEAGQHIGFFTRRSLEMVAERLSLKLSSNGRNLHLLAPERISDRWLHLLRKPSWASKWAWLGRGRSLAHPDAAEQLTRLQEQDNHRENTAG